MRREKGVDEYRKEQSSFPRLPPSLPLPLQTSAALVVRWLQECLALEHLISFGVPVAHGFVPNGVSSAGQPSHTSRQLSGAFRPPPLGSYNREQIPHLLYSVALGSLYGSHSVSLVCFMKHLPFALVGAFCVAQLRSSPRTPTEAAPISAQSRAAGTATSGSE